MLSRDFVFAYLLGQLRSGKKLSEAKTDFTTWINKKNNARIKDDTEKQGILDDLSSYDVTIDS